jgi:hypothetical protein
MLLFLFSKTRLQSVEWKATVTPLASIIGSGFLVVTPLMLMICGKYAPLAITGIVIFAYVIGSVLRFNISHFSGQLDSSHTPQYIKELERLSYLTLSISYLISIAFYIKLLSYFLLKAVNSIDPFYANLITTVILGSLGVIGKLRGFKHLESLEEYSVNIKLAIIAAMLAGLAIYNINLYNAGKWHLLLTTPPIDLTTVRELLGVIIIVQGFETSRYLTAQYSPAMRIKTMRIAQIISGIIYVAFITLAMVMFNVITHYDETTIIDVISLSSIILPSMLIIAAVFSQFSAAIADMIGAGGLTLEALHLRTKPNNVYLIFALMAIILIWMSNVFQIVTIASRAFALYYAIQAFEAAMISYKQRRNAVSISRTVLFLIMFIVLMFSVVYGIPV